jgi:hypothetical protein
LALGGLALRAWGRGWALGGGAAGEAAAVFRTVGRAVEVVGPNALAVDTAAELARQAWATLAAPLELPQAYATAVVVRLIPAEQWGEAAAFRAWVEPGGVVSVRVAWREDLPAMVMRRALVQGILLQQAVARHGATERITVPLWLEMGAVGWWITRAAPARFDEWQQDAAGASPVGLAELLAWQRGEPETRARELAALWWFTALVDSGRGGATRWRTWRGAVLGGADATAGLARLYPEFGDNEAARERWWTVTRHRWATARAIPSWTAEESRARLRELLLVVLADESGRDVVLGADDLWAARREQAVRTVIERRLALLGVALPSVHPFYRNATISAGMLWEALRDGNEALYAAMQDELGRDVAAGRDLEETTAAALDVLNALGVSGE